MPSLLVLTQTHNNWGGIEAWMSQVFPFLADNGWDLEYGLALGRQFNQPERFLEDHSYMRRVHMLDGRAATPGARRNAVGRLLNRVAPDVVMPLAIGDAIPALREQRRRGLRTKIVLPVHSLHCGTLADLKSNVDLVDMVTVVSGLLNRWVTSALGMDPTRLRWVRNGVPASSVRHIDNASTVLRVGYVGRLDDLVKRASDAIGIATAACGRGVALSLDIVGDGPARQEIEAHASRFGKPCLVRLHGYQNRRFLYERIYPQLDCLLLTSSSEGSPLAVIEAMQHGVVPVVSEFFGYASEGLLLPEQNCLSFPVGDIDAASREVARLASDRSLLQRLSIAARAAVRPRYAETSMLHGWMAAASDALSLPDRPALPAVAEEAYGRLDQWGLPPSITDAVRRFLPSQSRPASGFDEWPGSLCTDPTAMQSIEDELRALESQCVASVAAELHAST